MNADEDAKLPSDASSEPPRTVKSSRRGLRWVLLALKVALASALVGWLMHSKSLDLGALRFLVRSPTLFAWNLGAWLACSVLISTTRWRLLLGLAGVKLGFVRATQLQLSALFFNVVIPGNVGGDVLKALHVARSAPPESRTPILLLVLVERIAGLFGLVLVAAVATTVRLPSLWQNVPMRSMVTTIYLLAAGCVLGSLVVVAVLAWLRDRTPDALRGPSRLARLVREIVAGAILVARRPMVFLGAVGLSMALHGIAMAYFTVLTSVIVGPGASYGAVAALFPIGLLTVLLPISPAGVGVGHVAFDRLYHAVGLTGGATIFNVFIVGQIAPCLLGAFAYVSVRSEGRSADKENALVEKRREG